jgi:23S rRNA (cytidine1920-2'-O)/16S rRNA (cytidine1409-2'-O)-methyltransferase
MTKTRLDLLLVEHRLADSRASAQAVIMAGQVRVNGEVEIKPSAQVSPEVELLIEAGPRFVSRGGEKLEAALAAFPIPVAGRVCADVGASTGGFSDCLLQHGAARVYAIDVGRGLLHWKLRNDPRLVVMERTNARLVTALPEAVGLVSIDASFISLKLLLPVVKGWFTPVLPIQGDETREKGTQGDVIALVKPQFEAGRREAARGRGVIRDPEVHQAVLKGVLDFACAEGYTVRGQLQSPVIGPKGNIEFLLWLSLMQQGQQP